MIDAARCKALCSPSGDRPSAEGRWAVPGAFPSGWRRHKLEKKFRVGRIRMTRSAVALVLTVWPLAAFAQQAGTPDGLTDVQRHGRQLFAQSCGVCHLPPAINARTYGPPLSKETA